MYVLTPGARVRFISGLNPDCVLGATGSNWGRTVNQTVLRNLSTTNNSSTEWIIEAGSDGLFKVKWVPEGTYLQFMSKLGPLLVDPDPAQSSFEQFRKNALLRADPVRDGNWFALNRYDGDQVMDVRRSDTLAGTSVISFPWNGGDNQIWRTEEVK